MDGSGSISRIGFNERSNLIQLRGEQKLKKQKAIFRIPENEGQVQFLLTKGGARQGAGRKGIGITKKVSLTLPEEGWRKLDQLGEENGKSRSENLREIITSYFDKEE